MPNDTLQALFQSAAPTGMDNGPIEPWRRIPGYGESVYTTPTSWIKSLTTKMMGDIGIGPMAMAVEGGGGKILRQFAQPEIDKITTDLYDQIYKAAHGINRQFSDEIGGNAVVNMFEMLKKGLPIGAGDDPKGFLMTALRQDMKDHVEKLVGRSMKEVGIDVPGGGGLSVGETLQAPAPSIPTKESVGKATPIEQQLIKKLFIQGKSPELVRQEMGPKGLDQRVVSDLFDRFGGLKLSYPDQLKSLGASPKEIFDAITEATTNSTSPKLRSFAHPTTRYLVEGLKPEAIAKGLGYKPNQLMDFTRRLQAVTNDVMEIIKKKKGL